MLYAFLRKSKKKQHLKHQRYEVVEFVETRKLGKEKDIQWVSETATPTLHYSKRELGKLIDQLQKDDVLVITEISRFGGSLVTYFDIKSKVLIRKDSLAQRN